MESIFRVQPATGEQRRENSVRPHAVSEQPCDPAGPQHPMQSPLTFARPTRRIIVISSVSLRVVPLCRVASSMTPTCVDGALTTSGCIHPQQSAAVTGRETERRGMGTQASRAVHAVHSSSRCPMLSPPTLLEWYRLMNTRCTQLVPLLHCYHRRRFVNGMVSTNKYTLYTAVITADASGMVSTNEYTLYTARPIVTLLSPPTLREWNGID